MRAQAVRPSRGPEEAGLCFTVIQLSPAMNLTGQKHADRAVNSIRDLDTLPSSYHLVVASRANPSGSASVWLGEIVRIDSFEGFSSLPGGADCPLAEQSRH
jgi:hypothetical protein